MPKVVSELSVEGRLHTELSLDQLSPSKHLIFLPSLTGS